MSMITGNPDLDFWEQNPELKYRSEFKRLLKEYSKEESSKIMWSVYLMEDPDSKFYNIPEKDRLQEIQDMFNPDFDPEEPIIKELITVYPRVTMDKDKIMFKILTDKMDELTAHLRQLNLDEDKDFNKTVRIMEKLSKIWEGHEKVKEKFIESQSQSQIRGNAQESAREKRRARN